MDQYTPELLKDLEEYVIEDMGRQHHEHLKMGNWYMGDHSNPFKVGKFLEDIDYDSMKLIKMYGICLNKKNCDVRLIGKKIKVRKNVRLNKGGVSRCLEVCRILIKPMRSLPLILNKTEGMELAVIRWRLTRGI